MAKSAADVYRQLLTEEPIVLSVAVAAAFAATMEEFGEQGKDAFELNVFMTRMDEHLEFLEELYPSEPPE